MAAATVTLNPDNSVYVDVVYDARRLHLEFVLGADGDLTSSISWSELLRICQTINHAGGSVVTDFKLDPVLNSAGR